MAVVSFCLVVLLGLLSTGLMNSKKSNDDTNIAGIVWQVSNTLRSETTANLKLTTANLTVPGVYYFDINGQLTNAPTPAYPVNSPSHFYTCALTNAPTTFSTLVNAKTPATTFSTATFSNVLIQISCPGHAIPFTNYVTIPPP
jgi:hypothetical protein